MTERIQLVKGSWDQYSITGLKVQFQPYANVGAATAALSGLKSLVMLSVADNFQDLTPKTTSDLAAYPGFKNLNPFRPLRKWQSCKKLSK